MGTRHLVTVRVDGQYKVAQYGQWDGYPTGQGKDICEFIQDNLNNMDEFAGAVRECEWITEEEHKALWEECGAKGEWVSIDISNKFKSKYPHLHRDAGGYVLQHIKNGARKLEDSLSFGSDGLFCEWAYVVDLDEGALEVHRGGLNGEYTLAKKYLFVDATPDAMSDLEELIYEENE